MAKRSIYEQPLPMDREEVPGRVGIVTITYNSGDVLPDFFDSLGRLTYKNYILYAVDNASRDNSVEILSAYKDVEIRVLANEDNVGVAAGNNQGIRAAMMDGCEYVLLINNDVVFEPELLQGLIDTLARRHCEMSTPMMYFYDPKNLIWCAGGGFRPLLGYVNYHRGGREIDKGQYSAEDQVTYAPTCCVLFRREVFGTIGLMDERYFVYRDDTDFLYRAYKRGLKMYFVPRVKLWHKVSSLTVKGSAFDLQYGTRNRALFLAKYYSKPMCYLFTLAYYLLYGTQLLRGKIDRDTFKLKRTYWADGLKLIWN